MDPQMVKEQVFISFSAVQIFEFHIFTCIVVINSLFLLTINVFKVLTDVTLYAFICTATSFTDGWALRARAN